MGLGDKVIAASSPKEEVDLPSKGTQLTNEENDKEPLDDEDCFCICFCDEDEKDEKGKSEEDNGGSDKEEESADLVDPYVQLKQSCAEKPECVKYKQKLDDCNARVESRSKTSETCVEELIDFMHCVDHCASKTIFSKLK